MTHGTARCFDSRKGFGFVPDDGGKDVFVHIGTVERAGLNSLNDGQTVEYEIESNRRKEPALNLKTK
jgi:cold shock protein